MSSSRPSNSALRVAELATNSPTLFLLTPNAEDTLALADTLQLIGLRKLRFVGDVSAHGAVDWLLTGQLGATVTQPCTVTLAPVTTRIDLPVRRVYLRDFEECETLETEMPENDEVEPLTDWIDPEAVLAEALSLALPDYPRVPGAYIGETVVTEPGAEPLRDADLKPFAGLASLKAQLNEEDDR